MPKMKKMNKMTKPGLRNTRVGKSKMMSAKGTNKGSKVLTNGKLPMGKK